ncbi:conserved hypothetical protein [Leishmania infantum JPCM5]|uniref:Ttaggg_binding_factor_-_putative n=2 Tax=Leishmania infantum TaxID=5671 RepID=A0A6L0X7P1_LEIIN|nr:conserved hypothetical protein [Leishmania infantum JPCM5]CAC9481289.1 ttaggg_binding_factor_-_putative [Leishmania infantum]CAM67178.1 conserved hypothetical protein [Leishmania infantum JPCM5]SUZ41053.1 ttaggg_binding_factor_-_putative [Leishmania infantum]|eukprot:XP_001464939.1 conserved hypothetical protein [Leishmania infantum JPCM5]
MPATSPSSAAATPASGGRTSAADRPQREPQHGLGAGSAMTIARGDDSGSGDRLLTDAKHDVQYFDVFHPILLSHVRRANSDGVLALLSLPSIAESDVFWRTCTYREGLVAAVLIHVMEHTGQLTVPASPPTLSTPAYEAASPPGILVNSQERADDSPACSPEPTPQTRRQPSLPSPSPHSSPAPSVPSDAIIVADDGLSPASHSPRITPLTVDDLHVLLHLCSREGAEAEASCGGRQSVSSPQGRKGADSAERPCVLDRRHPPALASLLQAGKALRQQRSSSSSNTSTTGAGTSSRRRRAGALQKAAAATDLELYIQSVMRRLEAMKGAQTQLGAHNLDAPAVTTRKRPRSSNAPTTSSASASSGGNRTGIPTSSGPDSFCGMRGEVMATAPTDAVDLAALAAVLQEHCHDMVYVNPLSERLAAPAAVEESTDSTTTTATTIMGISSSNSNGSLTNAAHAAGTTTAHATAGVAVERTSMADLVDAAPEAVSESAEGADADAAEYIDAQDLSGGLDAVALLRRIPAISATRWALPSGARSASNSGADETGAAAQRLLSATATTAMARTGGASVSASSLSLSRPLTCSSIPTTAAVPPARDNEEEERVSAAIRAFDAFTTALEQSAATTAGVSAGPPQSSLALSAPSSSSTGNLSSRRAAARHAASGALHPRPPVPPPSSTSKVRRRHKFSPQEDAAILHGVARFGQVSGSFQYILHAYRSVWRAGRTALHLYDHWRGALRRRAVAAASDEATSHADRNAFNEALDDRDDAERASPIYPATPDCRQDLSSDIEDFSDDS